MQKDFLLFGLGAADLAAIVIAAALLAVVATLEGILPVRHASQVDPLVALCYE